MSQPIVATAAPIPFLRRAFDWWLAQVRQALPPTIFFFIGFNLILWTKRLVLEEHGIDFSGFFTATLAACWSERRCWQLTTCRLCAALMARR